MILWKSLFISVLTACVATVPVQAQETFASPNNAFTVEQASGKGGQKQTIRIIAAEPQKTLFSWQSPARSIEAVWEDNSAAVAVNNYVGNSGDAVYVVAITGRTAHLLRQPDSDKFLQRLRAQFPKLQNVDRFTLAADRWEGSKLIMSCDGEARDAKDQLNKFRLEISLDTKADLKGTLVFGPLKPG